MKPGAPIRICAVGLALVACDTPSPPLIPISAIVDDSLPVPLTPTAGDVNRGVAVFVSRETGHCILCHAVDALDAEFQGTVGPPLTAVGDRLSTAQLRLRVIDYQRVVPGALMPSYYRVDDLYQVLDTYADTPILTAQQVEDVVAYLGSLKDDDPAP